MKKLSHNRDKQKMFEYDDKSGHNYRRLRTEHQRKANNALDKVLKLKNFDYRIRGDDAEYL